MEVVRKFLKNPNFAKTLGDKIASSVFVIGGIFTLWYEVNILMYYAQYDSEPIVSNKNVVHLCIAACLYIGTMTNWYKLITTRTYAYYNELQQKQQNEWKYCSSCFSFYPPRAHHCKICGICILKRDHHCWFAGTCIGHQNHRYYLVMVLHIFVAAWYCNVYNYTFVMNNLGGFSIGTALCMLFPHAAGLLGYLSLSQFFLCAISLFGFVCLVMFTWLLQIQVMQLKRGQTEFEKKSCISEYNLGFKGNLVEVLGNRYYVAWCCPWISSNLPTDGITFTKRNKEL